LPALVVCAIVVERQSFDRFVLQENTAMPWLPDSSLHPRQIRRVAIQAGAVGLLGLGMNHIAGLQALAAADSGEAPQRRKSVIYIFLSGGLAQHDSFDPKPEAPDTIRGEFAPIATQTGG